MIALTRHQGYCSTENEDVISSIILGTSLVAGRGIPVAGEYEIKGHENHGLIRRRRFF
jgi:L-arabinose isomerase